MLGSSGIGAATAVGGAERFGRRGRVSCSSFWVAGSAYGASVRLIDESIRFLC